MQQSIDVLRVARGDGVVRLLGAGRKLGIAIASSIILVGSGWASTLSPAAAAATIVADEPIAFGVGRDGDLRVLQVGGDGKSNSSPILMQPYRQGAASSVATQRWTLVRQPAATGVPKFTYQIKNPATGKCLNSAGATPTNGAAVILYTCVGATNEKWWMNEKPDYSGIQFRNLRDGRCIDIPNKSTANGAALRSWTCATAPPEDSWNQYFHVRTGKFTCAHSHGDGVIEGRYSALCIEPTVRFNGMMTSWHHFPMSIVAKAGTLPNEVSAEMNVLTLNAQGNPHGTAYFGWKAIRDAAPTASVRYAGYWGEETADGFQYRILATRDSAGFPNGSDVGDGQQHTYLMLGNAAGEWDLYFDYNFEGTTKYQASNRAQSATVAVDAAFLDATTFISPYAFRSQLQGPDGVWRRAKLTETTTGTPKTCGSFPDSFDITNGGGGNLPPWCLKGNRSVTGTGDALDVDVFAVDKPTTATAAAIQGPGRVTSHPGPPKVTNGVDQRILAQCLDEDAQQCLDTVPGLAACVAARAICNTVNRITATTPTRGKHPISVAQARTAAIGQVTGGDPTARSHVTVKTVQTLTAAQVRRQVSADAVTRDVPGDERVYLLSGTGTVYTAHRGARPFHRFTAVVDTNGTVLYAHLYNGS